MVEAANGGSAAGGGTALCKLRATARRPHRAGGPTHPAAGAAFEKLKAASASAAASLQASCPAKMPTMPVERIDAVEMQLDAMVHAAKEVRPALAAFYATLSEEQKARFNIPASSAMAAAIRWQLGA
jgi:hypothetical protein